MSVVGGECTGTLFSTGAEDLVQNQSQYLRTLAADSYQLASQALADLASIEYEPLAFSLSYDSAVANYEPFEKPTPPDDPNLEFDPPDAYSAPAIPDKQAISVGRVAFSDTPPEPLPLTLPDQPGPLEAVRPDAPPTVSALPIREEPDAVMPESPALANVPIPELPVIDLSALQASMSALMAQLPAPLVISLTDTFWSDAGAARSWIGADLNTVLAGYSFAARTDLRLTELLSGTSTGLPAEVESMMRGRLFAAEDAQTNAATQQARDEWAARGFSIPGGPLIARLDLLRREGMARRQAASRDVLIESAKWEIDNLRFAVQQGVNYEGQLRQHYLAVIDLSRQIATTLHEIAKAIVQVSVEQFNANLERIKTGAVTFDAWLKSELADLELARQQLEISKQIGTINQQTIDIYRTRVEAVVQEWGLYAKKLEADSLVLQRDKLKIEAHAESVKTYLADIEAWGKQWEGYDSAVKGELGKANIYESQVRGFSSLIEARAKEQDAYIAQARIDMDLNTFDLTRFQALLAAWKSQFEVEAQRIQAGAQIYDGKSRMYSAELGAESARVQADTRTFELDVEQHKAKANTLYQTIALQIEELKSATTLLVQAKDGVARTASQLCGSSLAAFNISAGLRNEYQSSQRVDCSTNYNVAVEG